MVYLYTLLIVMAAFHPISKADKKKTYVVESVASNKITVSGKGDSMAWRKANVLDDFVYPWENDSPPLTKFRALHDAEWLYLLYEATDSDVSVFIEKNDKSEVVNSDRVEIFFRKDEKMAPYYGVEIDPKARVLEYEATYHRNFDMKWSWPKGAMITKASITDKGYSVEVAISKKSLKELGLYKNNTIEAGIFRANCTLLTGNQDHMKWISWLKPDSPTADFHIPSAFGMLILKD